MKANFTIGKIRPEGVNLEMISDSGARMIDAVSREILAEYGMRVSDAEARGIFRDAGCDVDEETEMVKIPGFLINKALDSAPSRFHVYGRDDKNTLVQESMQKISTISTFGCGLEVCKYLGDGRFETRDSTDADLAEIARLCDWAENIDIVSSVIQSRDWVGCGNDDVHQLYTLLNNTTKHIVHINPVGTSVDYYWEILKAYYDGDEEKARTRPLLSMLVCTSSPLEIGENDAQSIIRGARYGIPLVMMTMALAGGSGPGYLAGSIVVTNCEILSQIVLSQLVRPGLPVWYGTTTTIMDMQQSTAPMGNPEISMVSASCAKLANMYGVPSFCAGMWSDSKVPDEQAASEKTLTSFLDALAGCSTIYGAGAIELGSTFSAEQLIIDNTIIANERTVLRGIEINEKTLSSDLIKEIGACGDYLAHPSTMDCMYSYSQSGIFDRTLLNTWRTEGSKNVIDRAHEVVVDVLANHAVEPIPEEKLRIMQEIVKRADEAAKDGRW